MGPKKNKFAIVAEGSFDESIARPASNLTAESVGSDTVALQLAGSPASIASTDVSAPLSPNLTQVRWDTYMANPLFKGIDGHGITIAILDTGIDASHAAFAGNRILYQHDFVDGDDIAQDDNGHGTHVASIAGGYDAGTYAGMATGVNFVVLKVLDADGSGSGYNLLQALHWVNDNAATYNISAINMSIGFGVNDRVARHDFMTSALKALSDKGIVSVGAAGNDYQYDQREGVDYPGSDPYSWAVGAVHSSGAFTDHLAWFSQRSSSLMDIAAPGVDVTGAKAGGGYIAYSGTSMATPEVTGAVALADDLAMEISGHKLDVATLRNLMRAGATTITDNEIADGVRNTGKNYLRLDVEGMLEKVVAYFQTSTAGNDRIWGWRGDDMLKGGNGDDTISGGGGADTIDGGSGTDLAVFDKLAYSEQAITSHGDGTFTVGNSLLKSIEKIQFSDGIVRDLGPPPRPAGLHVSGTKGSDSLLGAAGDDTLNGRGGSDTLDGGAGSDTATYATSSAAVNVDLAAGTAIRVKPSQVDHLISIENVIGSGGNDTVQGDGGGNWLEGGRGNDVIDGRGGDDTIVGGAGHDLLTGGAGSDRFVFSRWWGHDTISDLTADDTIDLTALKLGGNLARLQLSEVGGDLTVAYGSDTIKIAGFDKLDWQALVAAGHVLA